MNKLRVNNFGLLTTHYVVVGAKKLNTMKVSDLAMHLDES